ncbi:cell division cycle-associated protein 3 [Penaeus vannamei]|uniref:Uncharacterized protein n=1 Tax=Penaeus vannamei TaxID=6689 RepID=A0A3R7MJV4_PENVA|nr:cell division cycle-associated protein 3-like [Penaeus vannamei]XP_027238873.1 cell division cycle-associated protein 3-like [Penaeus vannamei]XP_027238874.1 cell division cycle-associated protein 3-like [Penaeus vannamei]XP_027238875.1 cell division cycle-associated protein 3-like [Penaeus vannamei]ROT83664.1 hypothetical protein C7M84_023152 [Penaeus vannamei]
MGNFTSKHLEEVLKPTKSQETPKSQVLPFDPRSPSDDITRTPIAVSDTPDTSSSESTPRDGKVVRVLQLDPRSPNVEVSRTPIVIETNETRRRNYALKPSKLAQLDTENKPDNMEDGEDQDPRSPTTKVPRTPLEDKVHVFEDSQPVKENKEDDDRKEEEVKDENPKKNQENTLVKKLFIDEGSSEKPRRPLASVQNTTAGKTPRGLIQAKQCRNVEEEYNKNHQLILTQLTDQENTVTSSTQFVESI